MSKMTTYAKLMKYRCTNPTCQSGTEIVTHHIIPSKQGGKNTFSNFICLCRKCHRGSYHSEWEKYYQELMTWKFFAELTELGVTSDCSDAEFLKAVAEIKAEQSVQC